jgi:hypothetical protein
MTQRILTIILRFFDNPPRPGSENPRMNVPLRRAFFVAMFALVVVPVVALAGDSMLLVAQKDGRFAIPDPSGPFAIPDREAAFATLSIRPHQKAGEQMEWTLTATIVFTKSRQPLPGAQLYVGYTDGRHRLVSIANREGKVQVEIAPAPRKSGPPALPDQLYLSPIFVGRGSILPGTVVRAYPFKEQ